MALPPTADSRHPKSTTTELTVAVVTVVTVVARVTAVAVVAVVTAVAPGVFSLNRGNRFFDYDFVEHVISSVS